MTSRVTPRTGRDAPARHGRIAAASAIALAVATVGVTAATAGETPSPGDPPSARPAAPGVPDVTAALVREPQHVEAVHVPGAAGGPAWLRRSAGELPAEAATAYLLAARTVHAVAPDCAVTAPLLAGLGRVVSDHGRLAVTQEHGPARPDTDGGRLDHDARTDRAVGPMRMLPATWAAAGVDADGDGTRDPRDADDAALAAAVYLCASTGVGFPDELLDRALAAWDGTPGFADAVRRLARAYAGEDYDAVWDAGRAAPVDPRAYAVVRVARHLQEAGVRVRTRTATAARTSGTARPVAEVGAVPAPRTPAATPDPTQTPSPSPTPSPTPSDPPSDPPPTQSPGPDPTPGETPEPGPAPESPTCEPTDGPTTDSNAPTEPSEPTEATDPTPSAQPTEPCVEPTDPAAEPTTD